MPLKASDDHVEELFGPHLRRDDGKVSIVYGLHEPYDDWIMYWFFGPLLRLFLLKHVLLAVTQRRMLLMEISGFYQEKNCHSIALNEVERLQVEQRSVWGYPFSIMRLKIPNGSAYRLTIRPKHPGITRHEQHYQTVIAFCKSLAGQAEQRVGSRIAAETARREQLQRSRKRRLLGGWALIAIGFVLVILMAISLFVGALGKPLQDMPLLPFLGGAACLLTPFMVPGLVLLGFARKLKCELASVPPVKDQDSPVSRDTPAPNKPISIACSNCKQKLRARPELAGKRVKCPGCQQPIVIPIAEPPPLPAKPAITEPIAGEVVRDTMFATNSRLGACMLIGLGLLAVGVNVGLVVLTRRFFGVILAVCPALFLVGIVGLIVPEVSSVLLCDMKLMNPPREGFSSAAKGTYGTLFFLGLGASLIIVLAAMAP
jgi:hypothetical protein